MNAVEPLSATSLLSQWGSWALLLVMTLKAISGVVKGQWVPGYIYRKKEAECDELRATAERAVAAAGDALRLAGPGRRAGRRKKGS